jgi:hypothetical protein
MTLNTVKLNVYAVCCDYLNVMLTVIILNVVMLSVVAPNQWYLFL